MKSATITEVKNGLSALIDRVRAGESIVITDRGVPVAVIEPAAGRIDIEDRLARLERAGLVRRGSGSVPVEALRPSGPTQTDANRGTGAVEALLDERRDGR